MLSALESGGHVWVLTVERDDTELLATYEFDRDESAFAVPVNRHSAWIFTAARRRLGDPHLAEDAVQAVFLILAEKACELSASKRGSLAAWLFHVMHFTCSRLRRTQSRQTRLDRSAGMLRLDPPDSIDSRLVTLMEDTIAQLPTVERELVVRRFYQRQEYKEIGAAFDLSAEAVRKRIGRSLAQVGTRMMRDGIDVIPESLLSAAAQPATKQLTDRLVQSVAKEKAMAWGPVQSTGGFQLISTEFLVKDVEANLEFFEKLGFPRRFTDAPDPDGKLPRASLTAGQFGKIWIRRAPPSEIHPSTSFNVFFWIDGGPDALVAHRRKIADMNIPVTEIIDEYRLPNFNVTTPDGYQIAFFTAYVAPEQPPVKLKH